MESEDALFQCGKTVALLDSVMSQPMAVKNLANVATASLATHGRSGSMGIAAG